MRIASLISESLLKAGGYEIFTYNLLAALAAKGHDVVLYITDREYRKNGWFYDEASFQVVPMPWNCMSFFKRAPFLLQWWIRREQRKQRFDVWQVMGAYPEGAMVRSLAGEVPLVLRTHGDDIQIVPEIGYGMRLDPAKDTIIRECIRLMDRVVALTPSVVHEFEELDVPQDRIEVIPNGINFKYFSRERDVASVRDRWGIGQDEFVLLTVGRNHPKKGFDLIPRIAGKLRAAGFDSRWLVVGKDSDLIDEDLRAEGVDDFVRTIPSIGVDSMAGSVDFDSIPVEELVELYAMSDVFFFPSRIETFGRVLLESMAGGTPVITTNCLGCRDVVNGGEYGVMVDVDDVDAMTEAIVALAGDPGEMARFRDAGLRRAAEYDWNVVADSYLNLYQELAGNR